jgi:hypothetical protein
MPLRTSLASCELTSFLKTERECDERCAMVWGEPPREARRVSVDSMNSWALLVCGNLVW